MLISLKSWCLFDFFLIGLLSKVIQPSSFSFQFKPKASIIRFQIKSGPRHTLAKLRNIVKAGYRKDCRSAVLKKASAIIRSEKTRVAKKAKPAKKAE